MHREVTIMMQSHCIKNILLNRQKWVRRHYIVTELGNVPYFYIGDKIFNYSEITYSDLDLPQIALDHCPLLMNNLKTLDMIVRTPFFPFNSD